MDPTKRCTSCQQEKPLDAFSVRGDNPLKLRAACKACRSTTSAAIRQQQRRAAGIAPRIDRAVLTSRICRDCGREQPIEQFQQRGRQCNTCRAAQRRAAYAAHPEKRQPWPTAWAVRNRARMRANARQWQLENPLRVADNSARRNARQRNAALVEAPVNRAAIIARDASTCYLCGKRLDPATPPYTPDSLTLDHVIPLARGGAHTPENLRVACWTCNCSKKDRLLG